MFKLISANKVLSLDIPKVMGIVNVTDDSFYKDSRSLTKTTYQEKIDQMVVEGADIIDIGGQSTRPGSVQIGADEEVKRITPAIEYARKKYPGIWLSIDTYHASVAAQAVSAGADIINDVSGGEKDSEMIPLAGRLKVPFICMHMQGSPEHMQNNPTYENVCDEVIDFFKNKIQACKLAGIESLILDQGYGFGKNIEHNYQLLSNLHEFTLLGYPILVGVSRKSMIYKVLGNDPQHALNGSSVLHTIALLNGAQILRVHDVKEARECITLTQLVKAQMKKEP
jgi:dihydropteroate synthase